MSKKPDIEKLDLTDRELMTVLKNHGVNRRSLMKVFGVGAGAALFSGSVAAHHNPDHDKGGEWNAKIDPHFGYSSAEDQDLTGTHLEPDRTVGLHIAQSAFPFHFDPMGIHIGEGDKVRFDYLTPDHTITAYHLGHGRQQRVPDSEKAFSSPIIPIGGFWLYEFDSPGVYDIYCGPHEFLGMVMRIVVGDPTDPDFFDVDDFSSDGRPPVWREEIDRLPGVNADEWVFPVPAETFANSAMSVSNIVNNGPVTHEDL